MKYRQYIYGKKQRKDLSLEFRTIFPEQPTTSIRNGGDLFHFLWLDLCFLNLPTSWLRKLDVRMCNRFPIYTRCYELLKAQSFQFNAIQQFNRNGKMFGAPRATTIVNGLSNQSLIRPFTNGIFFGTQLKIDFSLSHLGRHEYIQLGFIDRTEDIGAARSQFRYCFCFSHGPCSLRFNTP